MHLISDEGRSHRRNLPEGVRNGHKEGLSSDSACAERDAFGHDRGQVSDANLPDGVRNGHKEGLSNDSIATYTCSNHTTTTLEL